MRTARIVALGACTHLRVNWLLNPNHDRVGRNLGFKQRDGRPAYEVEFPEDGPGGARRFVIPANRLVPSDVPATNLLDSEAS